MCRLRPVSKIGLTIQDFYSPDSFLSEEPNCYEVIYIYMRKDYGTEMLNDLQCMALTSELSVGDVT